MTYRRQIRRDTVAQFVDYQPPPQNDPLVVYTADLAKNLKLWINEHTADHAFVLGRNRTENNQTTALEHILFHSKMINRRLYAILNNEFLHTGLCTADRILTSIDMHHLLFNEIPVIANPHWSQKRWRNYMIAKGCDPDTFLSSSGGGDLTVEQGLR